MCGIVGAIGSGNCSSLLLDCLKRLEYRGYDSSGIVTHNNDAFNLRRSVGKIVNLEKVLVEAPLTGAIGLGHTRWATHGGISESNAHPHIASNRVAIVHNGIIENYKKIRERLEPGGYEFLSDTDSEVLAHLFLEAFDAGLSPDQATRKVISEIEGAYAFGAISIDFPNLIIVARNASPLAIGLGDHGSYIGSDATALAHITRKVIYLKDLDYALIKADEVQVFGSDGIQVKRETVIVSASPGLINKGGYRHFMEKEIHEQPASIANTIAAMTGIDGRNSVGMSKEALKNISGIVMLAAGTSHISSLVARYWIEKIAKIPVTCELASEYHYREPVTNGLNTVLAISQSGESLDTLKAMNYAAKKNLSTIALVNVADSTIAREAGAVFLTKAGPEIGVASTKAFTAQLTVLISFAIALGEAKNEITLDYSDQLQQKIRLLPGLVGKALDCFDTIKPIACELKSFSSALFLARGSLFPIALEGALKLKELSYIHAEGFAAGEMKHGPIALIEDGLPIIALIANDNLMEKVINNLKEASARGGRIILIADERAANAIDFAAEIVTVPTVDPLLAPILLTIPVQILAYLTALDKGTDVDQPRNLAKSVTVE
jgi:glucosamine--fructose-6-phosphate aminotransferase (isomerizing)